MKTELLESLLYEEESPTLDFKKEQYPFSKATEEQKSELVKDILGFANVWRRSEAYILIGVGEVRGGKSKIVGIQNHLDDHSLQQFINNLTNQPVRFHYEAVTIDDKQVGIIIIDRQRRPIYLKKKYGKLDKDQVYVRRGSSTDPTKPASLEEIAQMRVEPQGLDALLNVQFASPNTADLLGSHLLVEADLCHVPSPDTIPPLSDPNQNSYLVTPRPFYKINSEYYKELAYYIYVNRLFRPTQLCISNIGHVSAQNVRVELLINCLTQIEIFEKGDLPDIPKKTSIEYDLSKIKFNKSKKLGDLSVNKNSRLITIEIDCGDLQPGRRIFSDIFYIGKKTENCDDVTAKIYADNLPYPSELTLKISASLSNSSLTLEDLVSLQQQS